MVSNEHRHRGPERTEEELRRREARLRDEQIELTHANRVTATGPAGCFDRS